MSARYRVSKRFRFAAAHRLVGLAEGHPCARVHGHNYVVEVEATSYALDQVGMVIDYRDFGAFGEWIDATLDHTDLNDFLGQPTAENLAVELYRHARRLVPTAHISAVRVYETDKTCAEYRP